MKVSFSNYRRMNEIIFQDCKKLLSYGLKLNNDKDIFEFQCKLEKQIGQFLVGNLAIHVKSNVITRNLKKIINSTYAIATSSGTAALQFALKANGIEKDDEVITVPNTYIGSVLAISNVGAKPVFVDVNDNDLMINTSLIEKAITNRTKAIMPVHLYGNMCNMDDIVRIAKKHKLKIIEDASHVPIAEFKGKRPGIFSDAACYSFSSNKNVGSLTNGGMITTKNGQIFSKCVKLRDPQSNDKITLESFRTPAFMDWIQMIFVVSKFKHLKNWTNSRKKIADIYSKHFSKLPIKLLSPKKEVNGVFCDYIIRLNKRDKLMKYLTKRNIETKIHFPCVHLSNTYKDMKYSKNSFPIAEKNSSELLSIPINPFLRKTEVEYIIRTVGSFFK